MGHRRSASLVTRCAGRRSTSSTRAGPSPAGSRSPTPTGSTPDGPWSFPPVPHHLLRRRRPPPRLRRQSPPHPIRRPRAPRRRGRRRRRPRSRLRRRIRRQHPRTTPPHLGPSTRAEPVRLPSGSVVAGSFAAGVVASVAIGRLRRRHAYRYRPPRPGRDLTPPPVRPTLDRLIHASQDGTVEPEADKRRRRSSVSVQRRRAPPPTRTSGDRHP